MIIYNREWLDNLEIRKTAKRWFKQGLISGEEQETISKKYPTNYKESNLFARIGLFIFTVIIASSAFGLFGVVILPHSGASAAGITLIVYSGIYYFVAERFVRTSNYYRNGVTDALVYSTVFCFNMGVIVLITGGNYDSHYDSLVYFTVCFPLIAYAAIRFASAFLTLCAFACLLIINALLVLKLNTIGKIILPFECMAVSYLCYTIVQKQKVKENLRFWKRCFDIIEIASLVSLYLAGNYMVIRVLTGALLGQDLQPGEEISLAPFFYAFTILVPLVYLWLGLRKRNYVFLRLGLILEAAGILSIKYYHSFMPAETAMILAGIALIVIAYLCLQYLKVPKHGITLEAGEQSGKHKILANIATIAVSQAMASQPQPQAEQSNTEFGGGNFGGGGAGADF